MGARHLGPGGALAVVAACMLLSTALPVASASGSGIQWKASDIFYGNPAVAADGTVYVLMSKVYDDGTKSSTGLRAYDANGNRVWEVPVGGACTDLVVDSNNTVYFVQYSRTTYDSDLVAVSRDGNVLWTINSTAFFGNWYTSFGIPVVSADGTLLVTSYNRFDVVNAEGRLLSFSPDGVLRWSIGTTNGLTTVYAGRNPSSLLYVASYSEVLGVQPDGTITWALDLSDRDVAINRESAVVGRDGGLVMSLSYIDNRTESVNTSMPRLIAAVGTYGELSWCSYVFDMYSIDYGCETMISGMTADDKIIVTRLEGTGTWWNYTSSGPELVEGSLPAAVSVLDPLGQVAWTTVLPEGHSLQYPVISTDSAVYVFTQDGSGQGHIYAYAAYNGTALGNYSSPTELWVSGQAGGTGDRLYYYEGSWKGAEEGVISLICSIGLPPNPVEQPLDLAAASIAWTSVIGLAAVSGYLATRKR